MSAGKKTTKKLTDADLVYISFVFLYEQRGERPPPIRMVARDVEFSNAKTHHLLLELVDQGRLRHHPGEKPAFSLVKGK